MLADVAILGGLMGAMVVLLEVSHRLESGSPEPGTTAAVREAMRGPDGAAVRAEFRRSGIEPIPPPRRHIGFGI